MDLNVREGQGIGLEFIDLKGRLEGIKMGDISRKSIYEKRRRSKTISWETLIKFFLKEPKMVEKIQERERGMRERRQVHPSF